MFEALTETTRRQTYQRFSYPFANFGIELLPENPYAIYLSDKDGGFVMMHKR